MDAATVKIVADELWVGPDGPGFNEACIKIASNVSSYPTEGLIRQLFELKRRKSYLLKLDDKEEFERRLILRELTTRNIKDIDINEII